MNARSASNSTPEHRSEDPALTPPPRALLLDRDRKKRWNQPTKTHGYWAKDKMQTTFKFSLDPILTNAPGKTQGG